jgi:hypothetical protein
MKKQKKKFKQSIGLEDYIKAMKKGNREAQQEMLGPGFHSFNSIHKSSKLYSRKKKHKGLSEDI